MCFGGWLILYHFYPRSPCGERPRQGQPTTSGSNFYPRSPCGERLYGKVPPVQRLAISIHALLAESDLNIRSRFLALPAFLSTLSLRRATGHAVVYLHRLFHFYPRSPCGERRDVVLVYPSIHNFYPRSPCGERRGGVRSWACITEFLAPLSLRRATWHAGLADVLAT